jgi:hypothetical protein
MASSRLCMALMVRFRLQYKLNDIITKTTKTAALQSLMNFTKTLFEKFECEKSSDNTPELLLSALVITSDTTSFTKFPFYAASIFISGLYIHDGLFPGSHSTSG